MKVIGLIIWLLVMILIVYITHKMKTRWEIIIDNGIDEFEKNIEEEEHEEKIHNENITNPETYLFVDGDGKIHEEFISQL